MCLVGLEGSEEQGSTWSSGGPTPRTPQQGDCHGYVSNNGQKVTNAWLNEGSYENRCRGVRIASTTAVLKSPFDAANKRIQGLYDDIEDSDIKQRMASSSNLR